MNTSDAGWFKKFLGENPNAKALRERLEEATALLASKDEALQEQERRLTDATALAQRSSDSVRELEARVRDLTETMTETDLSRSVTVELLEQTEAQVSQMNDTLAVEHTKLVAANQAYVKADAHAKALSAQVHALQQQVNDGAAQVSSLEQECASVQKAKSMLEAALTRSERRREGTLSELSESRATGEKLSIACENAEARVRALVAQLEASEEACKRAEAESARCRAAAIALNGVAASALYAAVGHSVPVALRVGDPGAFSALSTRGDDGYSATDRIAESLESWLSDVGMSVKIRATSSEEIVIELNDGGFAADTSNLAMGYWVAGLTMQKLRIAASERYKIAGIEANASGATVVLTLLSKVRAAE